MKRQRLAWLGFLLVGSAWGDPLQADVCSRTSAAEHDRAERVIEQLRPLLAVDGTQVELTAIGEMPSIGDPSITLLTSGLRSRVAVEVRGRSCANGRVSAATVWFKLRALREVWVYGRNARPGRPVADAAPRREVVDVAALQISMADLPERLDGLWLTQAANAGTPVLHRHLQPEPLVQREVPVTVVVHGPGLMLRTKGRAMRAGILGERVPVLVDGAESSLLAVVAGKGEVHVEK